MSASSLPGESGGEVLPFDPERRRPAVPADGGIAAAPDVPAILDGQVVDRPPLAAATQYAVTVVRVIVTAENARHVRRHGGYVAAGAAVLYRNWRDNATTARYGRWLRMAEAAGDHEKGLEWEARLAAFRRDRHARRRDWLTVPVKVAVRLPLIAGGGLAVMTGGGILLAIARRDITAIAIPFEVTAQIAEAVFVAVSVTWGPLALAAPWIALAALWHAGRRHALGSPAGWGVADRPEAEEAGLVVTADAIVLALQHLPISALKTAFKEGWRPSFHTTPVRDGEGYFSVFSVPMGVTAEMIADSNAVFARNLHRAKTEVWATNAERDKIAPAGFVALWVANPGVLDRAAPEYPLLHEGAADVFRGVPAGVSPRGDALMVPIVGNNMVAGGMMGQGKSNACRVVMLGCATDPLCELDVFVFAMNGDFDSFAPRLAVYRKGLDDDVAAAAVSRLQELYEEVARREGRLADLGAKKVTRGLAEAHPDLRPIVALFSECHELFGHPEYGEIASELATKTAKRARKTAITLIFDTQASRKEAIPPKLVELVSVNVCFAVKSWRSNDGFLGDGSFQAGIRATELRPGRDRGTSVTTGVSDAQFELLRWHFVEVDDDTGFDAAADVIARTLGAVAAGTRTAVNSPAPAIVSRDLFADLAEVTTADTGRVRVADLPARLRKLAPAWGPYKPLTGVQLADLLEDEGVRVYRTGNVLQADPADIRCAAAGE